MELNAVSFIPAKVREKINEEAKGTIYSVKIKRLFIFIIAQKIENNFFEKMEEICVRKWRTITFQLPCYPFYEIWSAIIFVYFLRSLERLRPNRKAMVDPRSTE